MTNPQEVKKGIHESEHARKERRTFIGGVATLGAWAGPAVLSKNAMVQPALEATPQTRSTVRGCGDGRVIACDELGVLYAAKRQYSDAVERYQRALKIDSNNAAVHYRLGQALGRMGHKTDAQKEFSEYERLHQQQVADDQMRESSSQKFVYTLRSSGAGAK
jgi:predicted Zn-dependent protease